MEAFLGAEADDLDTDDDGVLDDTPWMNLFDDVAITGSVSGGQVYSTTVLDDDFGGGTAPGGVSRVPDGVDTDTAADWVMNVPAGAGLPGSDALPAPGLALNTFGLPNAAVPENGADCAVYQSAAAGVAIPDGGSADAVLDVATTGTVADVNVFLDITHARNSHLTA